VVAADASAGDDADVFAFAGAANASAIAARAPAVASARRRKEKPSTRSDRAPATVEDASDPTAPHNAAMPTLKRTTTALSNAPATA
jgi:hypothetical protein